MHNTQVKNLIVYSFLSSVIGKITFLICSIKTQAVITVYIIANATNSAYSQSEISSFVLRHSYLSLYLHLLYNVKYCCQLEFCERYNMQQIVAK